LKSGSLNLLELSGPLQACNGIVFYANYSIGAHVRRDLSGAVSLKKLNAFVKK
jgi:hypothetical protein